MQSSPFKDDLFPLWGLLLLLVSSSADSFSAYSLADNEQWKRHLANQALQSYWVWILMFKYEGNDGMYSLLLSLLWIGSGKKVNQLLSAFISASRSDGLLENDKLVADYMEHEHDCQEPDHNFNPISMRGYKYLVMGEDKIRTQQVIPPDYLMRLETSSDQVITVDKVWECRGSLLQSTGGDPNGELKDIFLSFALYRLLRRRFSGYQLSESRLPKTRAFVLQGLLSDHERAFRVIEVELAFLFDFFYTKYPIVFSQGLSVLVIYTILLIFVPSVWLAAIVFDIYQGHTDVITSQDRAHKRIAAVVTFVTILIIILMEIIQMALYLFFSDWSKLSFLYKYVTKPSWQEGKWREKLLGFVCRARAFRSKSWQNKLGQYSLLRSFNYKPRNLLHKLARAQNIVGLDHLVRKTREGQKSSPSIELPTEVKHEIVSSLVVSEGRLTNGISTLQRNGLSQQLSWACQLETYTHQILVWHIATTLCGEGTSKGEDGHHRVVAESLSKYCAYLVVFLPKLLPHHSYSTEFIFDKVVEEARDVLDGRKSMSRRYDRMMTMMEEGESGGNKIMERGARLGKQLMGMEDGTGGIWRVLAEFWAEMMLFVAPSENSTAHAERLARGGEFVTHLWALLSHAGILERDAGQG